MVSIRSHCNTKQPNGSREGIHQLLSPLGVVLVSGARCRASPPLGTYYGFLNVSSVFSFHPRYSVLRPAPWVCVDHDRQKSTVWRERQILDSDLIGRQEYRNDNIMICRHFSQIKLMTVPVIMVMTVSRSAMGGRYVRYDQMQHAATNPHT